MVWHHILSTCNIRKQCKEGDDTLPLADFATRPSCITFFFWPDQASNQIHSASWCCNISHTHESILVRVISKGGAGCKHCKRWSQITHRSAQLLDGSSVVLQVRWSWRSQLEVYAVMIESWKAKSVFARFKGICRILDLYRREAFKDDTVQTSTTSLSIFYSSTSPHSGSDVPSRREDTCLYSYDSSMSCFEWPPLVIMTLQTGKTTRKTRDSVLSSTDKWVCTRLTRNKFSIRNPGKFDSGEWMAWR